MPLLHRIPSVRPAGACRQRRHETDQPVRRSRHHRGQLGPGLPDYVQRDPFNAHAAQPAGGEQYFHAGVTAESDRFAVWLDGTPVTMAVRADARAGWVEFYEESNHTLRMIRASGRVEIRRA